MADAPQLPDDPDELRALLRELAAAYPVEAQQVLDILREEYAGDE